MDGHPGLDALCSRERVREILDALDPIDTLIGLLRAEGLSDTQIGSELGMSRQAVWARMDLARQRIVAALPELRVALDGRQHRGQDHAGHLSGAASVAWVADRFGVARCTVLSWIHAGRLPGAYREGQRWRVPRSALADFQPPCRIPGPERGGW
jgi:excisionase family DNA binding protein